MAGLDGRMVGQAVIYVDHRHRYKHLCKPSCKYVGEYVRKRHTYVTTELMRLLPTTFAAAADDDDVSFFCCCLLLVWMLFLFFSDLFFSFFRYLTNYTEWTPAILLHPAKRQFLLFLSICCWQKLYFRIAFFCSCCCSFSSFWDFLSNFPLFIFWGTRVSGVKTVHRTCFNRSANASAATPTEWTGALGYSAVPV